MCLGQAPLESYHIAVQRNKCWTLACFVSFWSLVEPQVCLLPSNLLFILCEELRGKWKRKKHEEIGQANRLCTVIFNTPLLLFKACCCFCLAALLPSSKPNLVQASLGGPLYWILVSQGVFLPASVCSWDKRKRRGERSCLSVLDTDLICSHQVTRYSFGGDLPQWLSPWQAGTL